MRDTTYTDSLNYQQSIAYVMYCFFVLVSFAGFDVIFELAENASEQDTPEELRCLVILLYVFISTACNVVWRNW